ncbi:uncharacterized protein LOC134844885 [Symsagittifera roscoffensis]|uniref:uncharacterized protein LOC134844885 n=1 Tax=Symsagittifera roscoffensis TaxID=84072 RepID=UPI00307C6701
MRDKHQNADSLSKKTEYYERLKQKQANQTEIKEGFSFLDKETYEALPLMRWLDKSGHPTPGHPVLPKRKEQGNDIQKETVTFDDLQKESEEVIRSLEQGNLSGETDGEAGGQVQHQQPGQESLSGESDVEEKVPDEEQDQQNKIVSGEFMWMSRTHRTDPGEGTGSVADSSIDDSSRNSRIDTYSDRNSSSGSELSELAIHTLLVETQARDLDRELYQDPDSDRHLIPGERVFDNAAADLETIATYLKARYRLSDLLRAPRNDRMTSNLKRWIDNGATDKGDLEEDSYRILRQYSMQKEGKLYLNKDGIVACKRREEDKTRQNDRTRSKKKYNPYGDDFVVDRIDLKKVLEEVVGLEGINVSQDIDIVDDHDEEWIEDRSNPEVEFDEEQHQSYEQDLTNLRVLEWLSEMTSDPKETSVTIQDVDRESMKYIKTEREDPSWAAQEGQLLISASNLDLISGSDLANEPRLGSSRKYQPGEMPLPTKPKPGLRRMHQEKNSEAVSSSSQLRAAVPPKRARVEEEVQLNETMQDLNGKKDELEKTKKELDEMTKTMLSMEEDRDMWKKLFEDCNKKQGEERECLRREYKEKSERRWR